MPGFDTLRNGDVGKRRKGIAEMISGCWRSCIETGNGTGPSAVDLMTDDQINIDPKARPFIGMLRSIFSWRNSGLHNLQPT